MTRPITLDEYFRLADRPPQVELVFGFLRDAPPLAPEHIEYVRRVQSALEEHLQQHHLGELRATPINLVLPSDEPSALVLHPAIAVVLHDRQHILRDRTFWGAPHLVVEVLTPRSARRTRCTKMRWYRGFGVQECWCIDVRHHRFEVLDLQGDRALPHIYSGRSAIRSRVLPSFRFNPSRVFSASRKRA
jgi:Uma2 family endonuclease